MPILTRNSGHPDPDWTSALERAVGGSGAAAELRSVYLEDREDLTVEADSADGVVTTHTRHRGLSARSGRTVPTSVHVSDPVPDDAAVLMRRARGESPDLPPRNEAPLAEPARIDGERVIDCVGALEAAARTSSQRARVRVRWVGFVQDVVVAASGIRVAADRRSGGRVRIEVRLVGSRGRSSAVGEAPVPLDAAWPESTLRELAARVMRRAEKRLVTGCAPTGPTSIVFAPGVGGILMHELVGHALEADVAARGSWLSSRERIGSDSIVVVDDPRRGRAPWRIDDEGTLPRPTPLIHEGRVRGRLYDRATAEAEGRPATGHGRRSSFREPVRPRMGCTFLAAGSLTPEEVVEGTTGVYVRRMESASTDPETGRAAFRITDADVLNDGRIGGALEPHLLLIDGGDVLAGLDRIGNDTAFDTCVGSCHRENQALAVSVGAPTFRLGVATVVG